jgi:hypothetical protein
MMVTELNGSVELQTYTDRSIYTQLKSVVIADLVRARALTQ